MLSRRKRHLSRGTSRAGPRAAAPPQPHLAPEGGDSGRTGGRDFESQLAKERRVCIARRPFIFPVELEADVQFGGSGEGQGCLFGLLVGRFVLCWRRKTFCSYETISSVLLQASSVLVLGGDQG